jgi:M6 family metalloprotease-like protein
MFRRLPFVLALVLAPLVPASVAPLHAQDVELLGRMYGTTPPQAYFDELARNADAFRLSLEGAPRLEAIQASMARRFPAMVLLQGEIARSIGPRSEPVVGTYRFPLVLGRFSGGGVPAYDQSRVQREFFDGPNSYGQTLPEFYAEMSQGLLTLQGETTPWTMSTVTASQVTRGSSGLTSSREEGMAAWIESLVGALDAAGMNWAPYDRTGDGYVDLITLMHPERGGECGGSGSGSRIWSHRWSVASASQGRLPQGIRTATPGPGPGGFIHVNDYTVQPLLNCEGDAINQIGVFAHEMGHGLGLPDLYSTSSHRHTGAGRWDLMATGSWGCEGNVPAFPCPMGAWSRSMLGWVAVEEISAPAGLTEFVLPPVQTSGRVLRVTSGNDSGNYLLLENRQRIGADAGLLEPGLLVWQIDPDQVSARWPGNTVNADPGRMGVRLRTASGSQHLESLSGFGLHGTRGDPYPGCIKTSLQAYLDPAVPCGENDAFHAGSNSRAESFGGSPLGITILGVERVGGAPFDIRFQLSTRWTQVELLAVEGTAPVSPGPFGVDGAARDPSLGPLTAAPFQELLLEAPGGASVEDGIRVGFEGWEDGGVERSRPFSVGVTDTVLVAAYGGREARVRWIPSVPGGSTPTPGLLVTTPVGDGPPTPGGNGTWFPLGTEVTFQADPRQGFRFIDWTGSFSGSPNPVSRVVDGPFDVAARFEVVFGFDEPSPSAAFEAALPVELILFVSEANFPIRWELVEGELPHGLELIASGGNIRGTALEAGVFTVTVRARDGIGLEADAVVTLDVSPPPFGASELLGPWLGTGSGPQGARRSFLDWNGNNDGFYDLGDLRMYLARFGRPPEGPTTRISPAEERLIERLLPLGRMGGAPPSSGGGS